jgi:hypothetical protein
MFKKRLKAQKAILIEKKVVKNFHKEKEVISKKKISNCITPASNDSTVPRLEYYLIFMTKRGSKKFLVPENIYNLIKIDSLVDIEFNRSELLKFTVIKKATKVDIESLGW